MMYDIVISVPTYKANSRVVRMLDSIRNLYASVFISIIAIRGEDVTEIRDAMYRNAAYADGVLFESVVNNSVYCMNHTYLWCNNRKVKSKYYVVLPDGTRFTEESSRIISELDTCYSTIAPCVVAISEGDTNWTGKGEYRDGKYEINPRWLNGQHFLLYDSIKQYGIYDSVEYQNPFYLDMDYVFRCRLVSGKPVACIPEKLYKYHHRDDIEILNHRNENSGERMDKGRGYWNEKYGIEVKGLNNGGDWSELFARVSETQHRDKMMRNMLYDNCMCNDFRRMYAKSRKDIKQIYSTLECEVL